MRNIETLYTSAIPETKKRLLYGDFLDVETPTKNCDELSEWHQFKVPDNTPECYEPTSLSPKVLDDLLDKYSGDKAILKPDELLNYAIIYSGIYPDDEASRLWGRLLSTYPASESFPFMTFSLNNRRLPVRAIPPTYQSTKLRTNFIARKSKKYNSGSIDVIFQDDNAEHLVGTVTDMLPLDSPGVIAYIRRSKGPEHKQPYSVTVNPLLSCGERCAYCYRQYGLWGNLKLGAEESVHLFRLSPDEMSRYIVLKYPELDFGKISHIGMITGTFKNFNDTYSYIQEFNSSLMQLTDGEYDPWHNEQGVLLMTHLATSLEEMKALKDIGVIELEHTLEVIDNDLKRRIMPTLSNNPTVTSKASVGFDQFLDAIPFGIEIFGPERYSVTTILGLDDPDTTLKGFTNLQKTGLKKLSFPIFQAYNRSSIGLYQMSFTQLINLRQTAKNLFSRQY